MKERIKTKALKIVCIVTLLIGTLILVSGCAVVPRRQRRGRAVVVAGAGIDTKVVYVQKAPPKVMKENRPKKPGGKAVWMPGHWQWAGGKYVWVSGHWEKNPRGKTWVPGKWDKKSRGWVWISGHWQ